MRGSGNNGMGMRGTWRRWMSAGLLGACLVQPVLAEASGDASPDVQLQALAASPAWHSLLYYRSVWGGVESEADDPAFFLSPLGKQDPLAEIQASVEAFAVPAPGGDAHPQCRFPARYHWLRQVAGSLLAGVPDQACPEFEAFRTRLGARGVTMVYPVPNMDDVSTLFGHSFLRLDRDRDPALDKSADYTLNFAALLKKGMGQEDLATQGLVGRLEGVFTILPYSKKLNEYLHMEARDIWEYRLDLDAEETAQLVRHAWEVRKARFEYEFFAENCSYRMLNFIDVARPGMSLRDEYDVYVIPLDSVKTVVDAGLVDNIHYQPSMESRWLARLDSMDKTSVAAFHAGSLTRDYLGSADAVPRPLEPAVTGHRSGRVQVSAGQREQLDVVQLRLRPAYHDFVDGPGGGPLAEITVLELAARQIEQQSVELTDLTFFAATSLKARNALYSPWSWRLATGVTGVRLQEDSAEAQSLPAENAEPEGREAWLKALEASDWVNPLYARLLVGPAWGNRDSAFYQLFGAEVQVASAYSDGAAALAIWNPGWVMRGEQWQTRVEMEVRESSDSAQDTCGTASVSLSRRVADDVSVFAQGMREKDVLGFQNEWRVGAGLHF